MTASEADNLHDKLMSCPRLRNWDELLTYLKPSLFNVKATGKIVEFETLAAAVFLLTQESCDVPANVTIVLLKCLQNSLVEGYRHRDHNLKEISQKKYCNDVYSALAGGLKLEVQLTKHKSSEGPSFPYDGVAEWTMDNLKSCIPRIENLSSDETEMLRLSTQFLCNLFTFGCESDDIPKCLSCPTFKNAIIDLVNRKNPILLTSCKLVHNAVNLFPDNYFTETDRQRLCLQLVQLQNVESECIMNTIFCLLNKGDTLELVYDEVPMEHKLYILEIIRNNVIDPVCVPNAKERNVPLSKDMIKYLSEKFCKRSDVILKTVDTYVKDMDPTEVVVLLDIIGAFTCYSTNGENLLKDHKSLLITCHYLLRAMHMAGKESNNFFTPIQKLSQVAPGARGIDLEKVLSPDSAVTEEEERQREDCMDIIKKDPQAHVAYAFKSGLIKIIGNMVHKNKACQDLFREIDGIPLLLDCCNIDARNPMIIQWVILALRNLCEGNPENQEVIRQSTKVGVANSVELKEMGLTLHEEEDGRKIGIAPLIRQQRE